jgi:hypothetical protein
MMPMSSWFRSLAGRVLLKLFPLRPEQRIREPGISNRISPRGSLMREKRHH